MRFFSCCCKSNKPASNLGLSKSGYGVSGRKIDTGTQAQDADLAAAAPSNNATTAAAAAAPPQDTTAALVASGPVLRAAPKPAAPQPKGP